MLMNNKLFVSFEYPAVQRDAIVVQQAHGIAKSGAERLRLDVCARFNFRSSIEL